jgi:hypothetical protein
MLWRFARTYSASFLVRTVATQGSARLRNGFTRARLSSTLGYYPEPKGSGFCGPDGPDLWIAAFGGVYLNADQEPLTCHPSQENRWYCVTNIFRIAITTTITAELTTPNDRHK